MKKAVHFLLWPCLVIVFGVLGWLTYSILELDGQREREFRQNRMEELTRLALWRMDSSLNTFLINENKRSPQTFFETDPPIPPDYIHTYFQMSADGSLISPQPSKGQWSGILSRLREAIVPGILHQLEQPGRPFVETADREQDAPGLSRAPEPERERSVPVPEQVMQEPNANLAANQETLQADTFRQASRDYQARSQANLMNSSLYGKQEQQIAIDETLLNGAIAGMEMEHLMKEKSAAPAAIARVPVVPKTAGLPDRKRDEDRIANRYKGEFGLNADISPLESALSFGANEIDGYSEAERRNRTAGTASSLGGIASFDLRQIPVSITAFTPSWINGELVLLRTVKTPGQTFIQGAWLDWERLADHLLDSARDILPHAKLEPFTGNTVEPRHVARLLAGIPMLLVPGDLPEGLPAGMNGLTLSLVLAWACALLAVLGVSIMIVGMMRLNERRGTFVSAVTHELRTPLTTFNLYTEMFMNGMVPPEKHNSYFATLQQEAARLTHLVDNVLGFSRIEKSTVKSGTAETDGDTLLAQITSSVIPVLKKGDMVLEVDASSSALDARLDTNIGAVEQIMVNLADNAVKYASETSSHVSISMTLEGGQVVIRFSDSGPGICPSMNKRLFTPFSRSAEDAAGDKPGIGLGLALSREIARKLGGDLKIDRTVSVGTSFILSLPARKR